MRAVIVGIDCGCCNYEYTGSVCCSTTTTSTRVVQYLVPGLAYGPQEGGAAFWRGIPARRSSLTLRGGQSGRAPSSTSSPAFVGAGCRSRYLVLNYPRTRSCSKRTEERPCHGGDPGPHRFQRGTPRSLYPSTPPCSGKALGRIGCAIGWLCAGAQPPPSGPRPWLTPRPPAR